GVLPDDFIQSAGRAACGDAKSPPGGAGGWGLARGRDRRSSSFAHIASPSAPGSAGGRALDYHLTSVRAFTGCFFASFSTTALSSSSNPLGTITFTCTY